MTQLNPDLSNSMSVREVRPTDLPFILDSWCRSYRDSKFAGTVTNDTYPSVQRNTVEQLMARGAKYLLAVSLSDSDQILGWVCYEPVKGGTCVHYLYVKDPYRRLGLGTYLSELAREQTNRTSDAPNGARCFYTHRTDFSSYFPGWSWQPSIARRKSA